MKPGSKPTCTLTRMPSRRAGRWLRVCHIWAGDHNSLIPDQSAVESLHCNMLGLSPSSLRSHSGSPVHARPRRPCTHGGRATSGWDPVRRLCSTQWCTQTRSRSQAPARIGDCSPPTQPSCLPEPFGSRSRRITDNNKTKALVGNFSDSAALIRVGVAVELAPEDPHYKKELSAAIEAAVAAEARAQLPAMYFDQLAQTKAPQATPTLPASLDLSLSICADEQERQRLQQTLLKFHEFIRDGEGAPHLNEASSFPLTWSTVLNPNACAPAEFRQLCERRPLGKRGRCSRTG